jgi:hypothetical protein
MSALALEKMLQGTAKMEELGDFPDGRFEKKYLVPDQVAVQLRDAMLPYLELDEHMVPGQVRGYTVYSLYLDSPGLDLYQHTRRRARNRIKLRVRYYDGDPNGAAFVEIKEKRETQVHKRRYRAGKSLIEAMLRDPSSEPVVHALGNGARGTAFEEFCQRRRELSAGPKLLVAYDREAYNSKNEPKVRVTFDRRIKTNACGVANRLAAMPFGSNVGGVNVLVEFKYAGEPPQWLTDVTAQFRLRKASFSKFAECMDVLGLSGAQPQRHKLGIKKRKLGIKKPNA